MTDNALYLLTEEGISIISYNSAVRAIETTYDVKEPRALEILEECTSIPIGTVELTWEPGTTVTLFCNNVPTIKILRKKVKTLRNGCNIISPNIAKPTHI